MKTIYKYWLTDENVQSVAMPEGARVLTVQAQLNSPHLWAEVDTEKPEVERIFETFGTGHEMPYDTGIERVYVGTYQLHGGSLVFHVYERMSSSPSPD